MNVLQKNIRSIFDDEILINKLLENNIVLIEDLWNLKQKDLKQMGFNNFQINQIRIKMQLQGIDVNKTVYSKKRRML